MADPQPGQRPTEDMLVDVDALRAAYYDRTPDPHEASQRVDFGTSGHRGSALDTAFNEAHIVATTQAIVEHRAQAGVDGPLYLGRDTHALSEPAWRTALEVLVGNGIEVLVDDADGYTPTPALSLAIIEHNAAGSGGTADGIVVTPSHNPPRDGGFKYNPPNGGPAGGDITSWVEDRANELLASGIGDVARTKVDDARSTDGVRGHDYVGQYLDAVGQAVDLDAIRSAGPTLGADPLGGAAMAYWQAAAERLGIDLTVTNPEVDPTFRFMPLDSDGKIRMDCSSPDAMAGLLEHKDRFDVAFGNDADADRHGIVTPAGLMNPNHYLAVAIMYLLGHRDGWSADTGIGKTLVSSSMIDRVVADAGRRLVEVPVGFKWFVDGLSSGDIAFGGEESAGASLLRRDGSTWTTDKDGLVMCLLAAEITAVTGDDPQVHYDRLTERHGAPAYTRIDEPADADQKAKLKQLSPDDVDADQLGGEPIESMMTEAPGNGAAIGGLKVTTESGWIAARPSGTEDKYKIYAESFRGADHLDELVADATQLVQTVMDA